VRGDLADGLGAVQRAGDEVDDLHVDARRRTTDGRRALVVRVAKACDRHRPPGLREAVRNLDVAEFTNAADQVKDRAAGDDAAAQTAKG